MHASLIPFQSFFMDGTIVEASPETDGLKPGEVSTGTTIMAVAYPGGVVLAADSRTSSGTYVGNRVSDKIAQLHDNIFCCRSGSAADTQAITDIVRNQLSQHAIEKGSAPLVATAAHLMRKLCYDYKDQLMAGVIVGGWDPVDGGSVYNIPLGGTLIKMEYAIGGSGSTYIYGLMDAMYSNDMNRDQIEAFCKKCVAHAMARDGSSGGVIRTCTIEGNGDGKTASVSKSYTPGDKLPFGP